MEVSLKAKFIVMFLVRVMCIVYGKREAPVETGAVYQN
jgi:hypothetical protein